MPSPGRLPPPGKDTLRERIFAPLFMIVVAAAFTAMGIDGGFGADGRPGPAGAAWLVAVVVAVIHQATRVGRGHLILRRHGGRSASGRDDSETVGWYFLGFMIAGFVMPVEPVRAVMLGAVGGVLSVMAVLMTYIAWVVRPDEY